MSHIFRSDEVSVGDRVVARRQIDGSYSDVLGHVVELNPLRIRPQEVGGFPSSLPAVEIPQSQLKIIKKLSPRTIRNSDIRAIEVATAAAFPGKEHTWTADGQWLMRAGDGVTGRSNSAAPLGPSAGFNAIPIDEIDEFYARHGLPTRLLLPERQGKPAERLLGPDWELEPEILVMTRELDSLESVPGAEPDPAFEISEQPDKDWLDLYHFRGQALHPAALEYLRHRIEGTLGFGRIRIDGETVAITRGTLTRSGDGTCWLGYSAVEVAADWRRRGLGTRLGAQMLRWGKDNGAKRAYLQVQSRNTPGIALYTKLGFGEHHRHLYATRR